MSQLQKHLGELCDIAPDDSVMEEMTLTKLHLNLKIDKEE